MSDRVTTEADIAIQECLDSNQNFALIAGAGSGKTTSLIDALNSLRTKYGTELRRNSQRVVCVTFTKRAVNVIQSRLGFDELYAVSTLHGFLWGEIKRFHSDIYDALISSRIPDLLAKAREKDSGRASIEAKKAREHVQRYEADLANLRAVPSFNYDDSDFSDYSNGQLSHDDIIEIAGYLMRERKNFRRVLGFKYPYIFVDEAQDTFESIVAGFNAVCEGQGLPIVGYFGDPWQQIYDRRAANFGPPAGGRFITKVENFRCSPQVIDLLNAFRTDVEQKAAGKNKDIKGSVELRLIRAENPEGERKRYTGEQIDRALSAMNQAFDAWGWANNVNAKRLFLARQMIARRLGFSTLQNLFTGPFASSKAQHQYETGEHFLLSPFLKTICPLINAHKKGDTRAAIDIFRMDSPAFDISGPNAKKPLKAMIDLANSLLANLQTLWETASIKDLLNYCKEHDLLDMSERLRLHLAREPRQEEYAESFSEDKADWLTDTFFAMRAAELHAYCDFMDESTAYSTQHGVKGEEYPDVAVIFDDVEAAWNQYSFTKLLTPKTAGEPTEGQRDRGSKLAYVCFSRAEVNLRILLFTPNPEAARQELIDAKFLKAEQIVIA